MAQPFTCEVSVRYRDLDTNDHVNNAVYASYLEEARIAYHRAVFDREPDEYDLVLAGLEIDFEHPVRHGDDVTVTVETVSIGTSSWTSEYELFVGDTLAATGASTVVNVDPETGRPREIPADIRSALAAYEGLA